MKIIGLHLYGFALLGSVLAHIYLLLTKQNTHIEVPIITFIGSTAILSIVNGMYNFKK